MKKLLFLLISFVAFQFAQAQKKYSDKEVEAMKLQLSDAVGKHAKDIQVMVDQIFSYSELGFQEWETSAFIISVLEKNGFTVEKGISGVPTAWMAKWGSGSPVIALGSDVDCIPKASQKPGVAYRAPIVDGAPGHGEGHNSGQAVIIYAAIAMKEMMEKQKMPGTIIIWPGVAEELVATKAWYVRDGYFKNIDFILSPSPPLSIGLISIMIAKKNKAKFIYNVQEIYPDLLIKNGSLRSKNIIGALKWLEKYVHSSQSQRRSVLLLCASSGDENHPHHRAWR